MGHQETTRSWRQLGLAAGEIFRVLQYNLLADSLAKGSVEESPAIACPEHFLVPGSAGFHYYPIKDAPEYVFRTAHEDVVWERRGPMIIREIISYRPDLVCLQEVPLPNRSCDFDTAPA